METGPLKDIPEHVIMSIAEHFVSNLTKFEPDTPDYKRAVTAATEAFKEGARKAAAISSNYVADREVKPTCVWFRNGRRVSIVGKPGDNYLDVQTTPNIGLSYYQTGGE